jgi:hypothetical protein
MGEKSACKNARVTVFRAEEMIAISASTRRLVCARAVARRVRFGTLLARLAMNRAAHRGDQVRSVEKIDVPNKERRKAVTGLLIRTALLFGSLAAITPAQAGTVGNGPAGNGVAAIVVASNAIAVSGATLDDAVATMIEVQTPR